MTMPGIISTARTLSYYSALQEITANNLANANSDGYKSDRLVAHSTADGAWPVPVQSLDLRQGTIRDTGRPLDVALEGEGFLVVRTPRGDRLTRGGSFEIDASGLLVDRHGNPVLGDGGPLNVLGRSVVIEKDGTVVVDGTKVGVLQMVTADPAALLKEGAGHFVAQGATTPAAAQVRGGAVEDANVDPLLGSVDLIMIQRAYSANLEALKAMDGVLGTVTEIGRG